MRKIILIILVLLIGCETSLISPQEKSIKLEPIVNSRSSKPMFLPGSNFNHDKAFWVPISYYAPVKDNTNANIRLLVPLMYDPDYGMTQVTTLNIFGADSLELDGFDMIIYSQDFSQIISYPPDEGQTLTAPYTDTSIVMIVYRDSSINSIPNVRYEAGYLNVPQKPIMGFYFVVTDYFVY